jgi:hypothetical protein
MRFNPEAKANTDLLPNGEYEFVVVAANESTSSNDNDMLVLKLKVGANGSSKIITDYVVSKNVKKVKKLAQACGLGDLVSTGELLPENFIGRSGRVRLVVEKSRNQNWPDRNVVENYVTRR